MSNSLDGLRILVTRPAAQAIALSEKLQQAGARPLSFPLLDIRPWHSADLPARLQQLASHDLAIFISRNAVDFTCRLLDELSLPFPPSLKIATIGKGTASQVLARLGRPADLIPDAGSDSEALLAEPELATMAGKKVIIFRGRGGREHLANRLRQRGAQVDYAEVYQRLPPTADCGPLATALQNNRLDVILVTSNEALDNLITLSPAALQPKLFDQQLLVIHPRQAEHARQRGFIPPALIAPNGSDTAILDTLAAFRKKKPAD